jgi:hypothetical protein
MVPDFTSIAMMPLKLSMYANTIRSSFYGAIATMRVGERFSPSTMTARYRMSTISGLLGDVATGAKTSLTRLARGESFTFGKTKNVAKSLADVVRGNKTDSVWTRLGNFRRALSEPSSKYYSEIKPWKYVYSAAGEKAYHEAAGIYKYGAIDKLFLSERRVNNSLQKLLDSGKISKSAFDSLTAEKGGFAERIAKEMVKIQTHTTTGFEIAQREVLRDIYGIETKARPTGKALKAWWKAESRNYKETSVIDLIRGVERGGKLEGRFWSTARTQNRMAMVKNIKIFPNQVAPENRLVMTHATASWNKMMKSKHAWTAKEAVVRAAQSDMHLANLESKAVADLGIDIEQSFVHNLSRAKWLRAGAISLFLVPQALKVTLGAIRTGEELMMRTAATTRGMFRMEFGNDMNVLSNARMATERQRAVAAIQNAHMNARYLMGNEAPMYQ